MGKSAPEAPPAPDPYATARAQTASNVSTSIANTIMGNANETSPLGTVRYNQTGSYKLTEPVLDANGAQTTSRRWVADGTGAPTDPQFKVWQEGRYQGGDGGAYLPGGWVDSRTGQAWNEGTFGGRWVDDPVTTTRDIPIWERITELSPEQQGLYDRQNQVQTRLLDLANSQSRRLQETLSDPLSLDGLPAMRNSLNLRDYATGFADTGSAMRTFADVGGPQRNVGPTDFSEDRKRVEDALYSRINPQLEQSRAALENQLVNQGFARGTEAFRNEMDLAGRNENDARLAIVAAGGQEQSRLADLAYQKFALENQAQNQAYTQALGRSTFYNMGQQQDYDQAMGRAQFSNASIGANNANEVQRAQFENTARERGLQERMAVRNAPINEISALLGQSQVQMPQFTPFQSSPMAATPVGDYVYRSADINSRNAQIAAQQAASTNGGLFGLGSALLGGLFSGGTAGFAGSAIGKLVGSDRRIKTAIRRVGSLANGLPLYIFRYKAGGGEQLGLMAQDVERVKPAAVREFFGVKLVDYELAVQ